MPTETERVANMAKKNTVEIILSAKDQASRALKQAFGTVESAARTSMSLVGSAAVAAAGALATLTGVIGKVGIQYNAMMEQSEIAWGTILGSQEEAKKTLQQLQVMGAKTPFEFEGLDKAAKLLNMAGFEGDNLFKTLTSVGDAVSAVGGGQAELEGISMAIFQMASKGKISAEEMNQLAERGIPAWQMIADAQGKSVQEVMKMSENGELFAKDVLPQLTEQLGTKFGGAMEKQSHTFNGMLSTIKDNLKMISAELMQGAFERFKGVLEGVIPVLDGFLSGLQEGGLRGGLEAIFPSSVVNSISLVSDSINFLFDGLKATYDMMAGSGDMTWFIDNFGLDKAVAINNFLWDLVDGFKVVKDGVKGAFDTVKNVVSGAVDTVKNLFSGEGNIGQSFTRIFETIKSVAVPILEDAVSFVKGILSNLKQFWDENGTQIVEAVKNLWSIIASIFEVAAPVVLFIVGLLWDSIKGVINGALDIIMGLIKVFTGLFTGDFSKMWEGIKQLFSGAIEFIWNWINLMMFGRILGGIKGFVTNGIASLKGLWTKGVEIFKNLDTNVWNIVTGFVSKIVGKIQSLYNQGASIFGTLKTFGANTFSAMWNAIKTVSSNIASGVKGYFSSMFTGAKFHLDGLLNKAKTIFNAVKDAITNPMDTAKTLVGKAIDSIKGFFSNISVHIPLPHFSVSMGTKSIKGVDIPWPDVDVNWYDKGGVFYGPQIVGVGEKRPEFVGALDDLRKIVREESGGGGRVYNINVNGTNVEIDENRLIKILRRVEVLYG